MDRRRWCLGMASLAASAAGLSACGTLPTGGPEQVGHGGTSVMPFSHARGLGTLPAGWHEHIMRRDLPHTRYQLARRDNRTVLHAQGQSSVSGVRCDVDIQPHVQPWLSWEWRVDHCPENATMADEDRDDSPARVVVAFDGDDSTLSLRDTLFREQVELFTGHALPFATLMYVWDGQAPPESVFKYYRSGMVRYLVVESGPQKTGQWQRYRRNVVDDYRRVFGGEPGRIRSVGLMSDGDDLKTRTEAWFGDLTFG